MCRSLVIKLQRIANIFFRWFENNHMRADPGKSHVLLSSNMHLVVPFGNVQITSSLSEKLLGMTRNENLKSILAKFVI